MRFVWGVWFVLCEQYGGVMGGSMRRKGDNKLLSPPTLYFRAAETSTISNTDIDAIFVIRTD